jgi:hypothetical protein
MIASHRETLANSEIGFGRRLSSALPDCCTRGEMGPLGRRSGLGGDS